MPRKARLDAPDLLQHITARGIEGRNIFKDNQDYKSFLERLALILEETQTKCYAWALLPDHFHLLLRTDATPLSKVMRRFMTGYAVSFNKRHMRKGHLFQNRYRSTVCEEDIYLLELIRYIHLNPLRAEIVEDLKTLDTYPWTGHSALLGRRKDPLNSCLPFNYNTLAQKTVEEIFYLFSDNQKEARRKYRQFVKKAINHGKRPDLMSGGPERNPINERNNSLALNDAVNPLSDQRILGSADFVANILDEANKSEETKNINSITLIELINSVCIDNQIDIKMLTSSKRDQKISYARAVISYLAAVELRYTITTIAEELRLSAKSVSRCIERGREIIQSNQQLLDYVETRDRKTVKIQD